MAAACLEALRSYVMAHDGSAPEIEGDAVVMGADSYSIWAATGYRARSSEEEEDIYPLGTVVLLVREKKASSYVAECASRGWPAVAQVDRSDLLAYVTGETTTSERFVESGKPRESAVDSPDIAKIASAPAPTPAAALDCLEFPEAYHFLNNGDAWTCLPGCDFRFALDICDKLLAGDNAKRKAPSEVSPRKRSKPEKPPRPREPDIIVVPNAMTSILTILNAPDFLEKGRFVTAAEKRAAGARKESSVTIQRGTSTTDPVKYRLVDNPTRLDDKEWSRVAAVFAHGPEWQFKAWKYDKPVDLFQRTLGIHLQFDDEATKDTIKAWNVHVLKISKTKRHLDQPVMFEFWRLLDDFLANKRPATRTPKTSSSAATSSAHKHRRHHSSKASKSSRAAAAHDQRPPPKSSK